MFSCREYKFALVPKSTYEPLCLSEIRISGQPAPSVQVVPKASKSQERGLHDTARGLVPNKPWKTRGRSLDDLRGEQAVVSTTGISISVAFCKITGQVPQKSDRPRN